MSAEFQFVQSAKKVDGKNSGQEEERPVRKSAIEDGRKVCEAQSLSRERVSLVERQL